MKEITFALATLDDLSFLLDLRLKFAIEINGAQSSESTEHFKRQNKEYFEKAIPARSFIAFLARSGNDLSGMGGMIFREQPPGFNNPSGRVGYLMNMYTLPSFRRQGVCSALLKLLIDEACRMGITSFELHASESGESVYKKNGFTKHEEPTYRIRLK